MGEKRMTLDEFRGWLEKFDGGSEIVFTTDEEDKVYQMAEITERPLSHAEKAKPLLIIGLR